MLSVSAFGGNSPKRPSGTGPGGVEARDCEESEARLELPLADFFFLFLASARRRRAAAASACASRSSRSSEEDDPAEDITYSLVNGTGESDTATSMAGAEVMIGPLRDELIVIGFTDDEVIVTASSEEGTV